MIIIQNCFWHGTQHLGPLTFFLVSKYGEWAAVTFFRLPTTFGKHRRYEVHLRMVLYDLCFYLEPFILRHRPGLVHCKPPLLSNLNGCIPQWWLYIWTTSNEFEQMNIVDTVYKGLYFLHLLLLLLPHLQSFGSFGLQLPLSSPRLGGSLRWMTWLCNVHASNSLLSTARLSVFRSGACTTGSTSL